jgi:hypothetical protein
MKWKEIPVGCRRWRDGQPQFQQMDFSFIIIPVFQVKQRD